MVTFRTETQNYDTSGTIDGMGATDIEFFNQGTSFVLINSRKILPNESWSINGFPYEKNYTKYLAKFEAGVFVNLLVVTSRIYEKK